MKFVVITRSISIHLSLSNSTEIEMVDINKVVSDNLKGVIIDVINKMRNIMLFFFFITNSAETMQQELIDSTLNCMVRHNVITNRPNSKGDLHFVNGEING